MPAALVGDTEIRYVDRGSGPVTLFVHGFPLDATLWAEQVTHFADRGRRCLAPDLAGYGGSGPVVVGTLTMDRHADDLAGMLTVLEVDRVDLVGLSMGGYVALAFAERHPAMMRTLALVDTRATADTAEGRAGRDAAVARLLDDGREAFAAAMAPALLGPDAGSALRARVRQMIESTRYETIVAALGGLRDRPDRTAVLEATTVPVGVIVGEHDGITPPAAAEEMAAANAGATLDVIPGAGHLTPIETPDEVASALGRLFDRGA